MSIKLESYKASSKAREDGQIYLYKQISKEIYI